MTRDDTLLLVVIGFLLWQQSQKKRPTVQALPQLPASDAISQVARFGAELVSRAGTWLDQSDNGEYRDVLPEDR